MNKIKRLKGESIDLYNERASKEYYANGYYIVEIAEKLKIDPVEVYNYVTTNNKKYVTSAEREIMVDLYNKGYSYRAISKELHRSRTCVKHRIEAPAKIYCMPKNELTDRQIKKILNMAYKGRSIETISKKTGIAENVIFNRLRGTDIDMASKHFTFVSDDEVHEFIRLHNEGKTHKEIAEITNRGAGTVGKHLRKAGIYRHH